MDDNSQTYQFTGVVDVKGHTDADTYRFRMTDGGTTYNLSATLSGTTMTSTALPELYGSFDVFPEIVRAGSVIWTGTQTTVSMDNQTPATADVSYLNGTTITGADFPFSVDVTTGNIIAGDTVAVFVTDPDGATTEYAATGSGSLFSTATIDLSTSKDGVYTVAPAITRNSTQNTLASATFTLNAAAPVATLNALAPHDAVTTFTVDASGDLVVSGTVSDLHSLQRLWVRATPQGGSQSVITETVNPDGT